MSGRQSVVSSASGPLVPRPAGLRALRCAAWLASGLALAGCSGGGGSADPAVAVTPDKDEGVTYAKAQRPILKGRSGGTHQDGAWSPVIPWPIIAIHSVLTPDGRLLTYGTDQRGRQTGYLVYDLWSPALGTGADSHLTLPNRTGTDLFCGSQIVLPDGSGQILLNGGDNWTGSRTTNTGNNNSNVFSSADNSLVRGPNMNRDRWYSTTTTLVNGETYVQGGSGGEDHPEIRGVDGNFRLLTGADTAGLGASWPRNYVMPDGRLFGFGVNGSLYTVDPTGLGLVKKVGRIPDANRGTQGSSAMFRPGHILTFGGQAATSLLIDARSPEAPQLSAGPPISSMRLNATATLLADGSVLATGGSDDFNQLIGVNTIAERYDPRSGQWSLGAAAQLPRLYHSTAILLPDATVMAAGGGAPGPLANKNVEIYSPPYLFSGDGSPAVRPVISTAPARLQVGHSFALDVEHAAAISRVTLLKSGSVTHGINMDQRFLELAFSAERHATGSHLTVDMSHQAGDTPPGYYLVFVFDQHGVPSVARTLWIDVAAPADPAQAPQLSALADRSDASFVNLRLPVQASDPNGDPLRYSAGGLPPGLHINPLTGLISGQATESGRYYVTVSVSDGERSAATRLVWTIRVEAPLVIDPLAPPPPIAVNTRVSYSARSTGSGLEYRWNFGDGQPQTEFSANASVTHAYELPGLYTVVVTVRDAPGEQTSEVFRQVVHLPLSPARPTSSQPLAYEPRAGAAPRLWVVNPDNDSVSVLDAASGTREAEIAVKAAPRSVAIDAAGKVWVSNRRGASLSIIDPVTLTVARTLNLPRGSQPMGVVMSPAGDFAYVALSGVGQLQKYKTSSFAKLTTANVGADAREVSISADGKIAWVSRFITPPQPGESTALVLTAPDGQNGGQVMRVDTASMAPLGRTLLRFSDRPDFENQGRGLPNYLGAMALSPDGTQGWVPSKQDNLERGALRDGAELNFQNTVRAIASRVDLASASEDYPSRIDLDNASKASAALFDPLGVFLFVALETSREVAVYDAHRRVELARLDVGRAPQGLAMAPDGSRLYVFNFMERSVSAFDTRGLATGELSLTRLGDWPTVAADKLTPAVLLGKQLFYDARDTRLARDRYLSCATCHEDGGHDGRTWDFTGFGEGLRNTIALRGRGGAQGPLHWSANFDEVQDFEAQIRLLAGGTGLISDSDVAVGTRAQPLGDRKAGLSAELDALAAYLVSLSSFDDSPYRASSTALTPAAVAGKALFASQGCDTCHAGAAFTTSAGSVPALLDVGTLKPSSGARLGGPLGGMDIPTLRDAWQTAPYLHDGSAATLEEAIGAHAGLGASAAQVSELAAYVQQIGREEAAPAVRAGSGTGLAGAYFNSPTPGQTPVLLRREAVDFSWTASPGPGVNADGFSVRWTGTLTPALSGAYSFQTQSNDGIRVWLDGQLLINNWTPHSGNTLDSSAPRTLRGGQALPLVIEYFDRTGGATARLRWLPPGDTRFVAVPLERLDPG